MRQHKCKFRILGLSATPGADGAKVQAGRASLPRRIPLLTVAAKVTRLVMLVPR